MSDVQVLSASLTGDTKGFEASIDEAEAKSAAFEAATEHAQEAAASLGKTSSAAGKAASEGFGEAAEGAARMNEAMSADIGRRSIREALRLVKDLSEAALEAASEMDPKAGAKYEESITELSDAAKTAAASLGEVLMPAIEAVAGVITNAIDAYNSLDDSTKQTIATVVEVVGGVMAAAAAFAFLGETFELLLPIFTVALPEIAILGVALAAIAVTAATTAIIFEEGKKLWIEYGAEIEAAAAQVKDLGEALLELIGDLSGLTEIAEVLRDISASTGSMVEAIEGVGNKIGQFLTEPLVEFINYAAIAADALKAMGVGSGGDSLRQMAEAVDNIGSHFGTDLGDSVAMLPQTLSHVADRFGGDLKKAFSDLGLDKLFADIDPSKHFHFANGDQNAAAKAALAAQQEIARLRQELDKQDESSAQKVSDLQLKAADSAAKEARDTAALQEKTAQDVLANATKNYEDKRKTGGASDIAAAKAAMDAAFENVQAAAATVAQVDAAQLVALEHRLTEQEESEANSAANASQKRIDAERAISSMQAAAAAASSDSLTKAEREAAGIRLDAAKQAASLAVSAAQQAVSDESRAQDKIQSTEDAIRSAQAQADKDHEEAWKRAADYASAAQKAADEDHQKRLAVGTQIIGAVGGTAGGTVQAAIAGAGGGGAGSLVGGGPQGAALNAGVALVEASEGFKKISAALNGIFQHVADMVGSVLLPIVPVIEKIGDALAPLFAAVSSILEPIGQMVAEVLQPLVVVIRMIIAPMAAVMHVIGSLLDVLAPIIEPIAALAALFLVITQVLDPLMLVLLLLAPLLNQVAGVIQSVVQAISDVWNAIIGEIQNVINGIANILPDELGGSALRDFASSLDDLKLNTDSAAATVQQFAQTTQAAADALSAGENEAANANKLKEEQYNLYQALQTAKANGASQSSIDAIQKALTDVTNQAQAAEDQANVDLLYAAMHATGQTSAQQQQATAAYQAALAQQADDEAAASSANTSATTANTQATQANTAAMLNLPTGFKQAAYEYDAESGGSSGGDGGNPYVSAKGGGGDTHIHIGQVVVNANDSDAFQRSIVHASQQISYKQGGIPIAGTRGYYGV